MKHAACVGHTDQEPLPARLSHPWAAPLEAHGIHTSLQLALSHTHTCAHTRAPDTNPWAYAFVMPLQPKLQECNALLGCHSQLVTMSQDGSTHACTQTTPEITD